MAQLIDKDALVAEIENIRKHYIERDDFDNGWNFALDKVLSFIDTIEVKEVDLEKYYHDFLQKEWFGNSHVRTVSEMMAFTAKHFFELGLNASNPLTWEDMMIIHKCCKDAMNCNLYAWETAEGQKKIYEDVLKRFKAKKGE